MSTDPQANQSELSPLPPGMRTRTRRFPENPITPHIAVPLDAETKAPAVERAPYTISWEDQKQGVAVNVHECEDDHVIADVRCTNASPPDLAGVSVGLIGKTEWALICKSVPVGPSTDGIRTGTKDFGTLNAIVKEIGSEIGLIVFLIVWQHL